MPEEKNNIIEEKVETDAPETEVLPVQDILQLIESQVANEVGKIEAEKQSGGEDYITAETLKAVIEEKEIAIAANLGGVDEDAVTEKIGQLEDKLKQEAQVEFKKVEQAVGSLANEGRAKFGEVETQVDAKLTQAVMAGMNKIAEAEQAVVKKAQADIKQAKEDGKAFLAYQIAEFKKEIEKIIDDKIEAALKASK